jgi:hypothetical protein
LIPGIDDHYLYSVDSYLYQLLGVLCRTQVFCHLKLLHRCDHIPSVALDSGPFIQEHELREQIGVVDHRGVIRSHSRHYAVPPSTSKMWTSSVSERSE